jgi:hypothetical protein
MCGASLVGLPSELPVGTAGSRAGRGNIELANPLQGLDQDVRVRLHGLECRPRLR